MHPVLARWQTLWLHLVAWALAGVGLGALAHAVLETTWPASLVFGPVMGLIGGPLWLSAWYVARAAPIESSTIWRIAISGLLSALVTAALWASAGGLWWSALGELGVDVQSRPGLFALLYGVGALAYLLALTVYYALHGVETSVAAGRRALEMEVAQRDAELRALRAQLDPHFLFNSLNSVAGLIPSDPERARDMCQRLADFFRDSLRLGATARITLAREIGLAEQYLRIEQVRFGARLSVRTAIAPDTADLLVPPLLLQPLVENAVRHGIAACLEPGEVGIATRRAGDRVVVAVTNPREAGQTRAGTGFGLEIVRRRLRAAYGEAGVLALDRQPGGFRATIVLPVSPAGEGDVT